MEGSEGLGKGQKAAFKRGRWVRPGCPKGLDSIGPLNFLYIGRHTELMGALFAFA